jgi:hypothetical protein
VGDHARALAHADAATTVDPLDEAAWRAVMAAHTAAGEPAAALAAYERLRQTLARSSAPTPRPRARPSTWPSSAATRWTATAAGSARRSRDPPRPLDRRWTAGSTPFPGRLRSPSGGPGPDPGRGRPSRGPGRCGVRPRQGRCRLSLGPRSLATEPGDRMGPEPPQPRRPTPGS